MYDEHAKPARGVASLETVPLSGGWQVLRSFGVPKYDDLVARLVGRDGALEQEWAVLMRDGAKYASPGQYVGPGTEQEIAANVSDRGGDKAAIMTLAGNQLGVLQPMIVMLKESVALLPRKIDAAQGRLASLRDRQGVQKLQKELDERKATAARTAKSLELLAKMILEPHEELTNLIETAAFCAELANDELAIKPAQEAIDEKSGELDRTDLAIGDEDVQILLADLSSTDKALHGLAAQLAPVTKAFEQTRGRAESNYDKEAKGKFKFGPLAARDAEVHAYLDTAAKFREGCADVDAIVAQMPSPSYTATMLERQHVGSHDQVVSGVKANQASLHAYGQQCDARQAQVAAPIAAARRTGADLDQQRATADAALLSGPKK